jgi:hypothetical protein
MAINSHVPDHFTDTEQRYLLNMVKTIERVRKWKDKEQQRTGMAVKPNDLVRQIKKQMPTILDSDVQKVVMTVLVL